MLFFRFGLMIPGDESIPQGPMLAAMATCHSLTVIDGTLTGDPLDLKMFEATNWVKWSFHSVSFFPFRVTYFTSRDAE